MRAQCLSFGLSSMLALLGLLSLGACPSSQKSDPLDFAAAKAAKPAATAAKAEAKPVANKVLIPPSHPSPVGVNLAELREYTPERPFNDAFKQSRGWLSTDGTTWDDGKPLAVDERGWVKGLTEGQRARSLIFWGEGVTFPAGDYHVVWDGTGTVDLWPQGGIVKSTGKGEAKLAANPKKGGIAFTITETKATDPIRNVRVYLPGADETKRWNPAFLDRLKGYGTLRFMDWLETNHSRIETPAQRPRPDDARYTNVGVPVEVVFDLCNVAGTDCWLNIGHTWSDELIEEVATVAKATLDPKRRLYVEYSNEVWNGIFPQSAFVKKRAVMAELSKDAFEAQMRWHGRRSAQVGAIFDRVFGERNPQVVRVLGAWAANAWSTEQMLDQIKDEGGVVDAVAIAPYFGNALGEPEQRGAVQGMGLNDLMAKLDGAVDEAIGWTTEQKKVCDKYKVSLIADEGGQHLVGLSDVAEDPIVNKLFDAANESPKMKDVYLRYLAAWKDAGGGLFLHFNSAMRPSKYGRWGALTSMEQPRAEAPKYDALMTFIEKTPRWY